MKVSLAKALRDSGDDVVDVGSHDESPVDFPDIAQELCSILIEGTVERGLLVCGTGVGASIAANKIPGIRAAVCHDVYSARQCVEHDDVNVLCLGAQIVGDRLALDLVRTYLAATHSNAPEFRRRVAKLAAMERRAVLDAGPGKKQ